MKTNDIDLLLKKSLSQDFILPSELERQTWQKMKTVKAKKVNLFLILMNILGAAILALQTIVILPYLPHTALRITVLYLCITSICIIICYQILSINQKLINLKQIL